MDTKAIKKAILEEIEKVHYQHRHDAGAMFGTLSPEEAEKAYREILNRISTNHQLSSDDYQELTDLIESKINNIPQVEREKENEYQKSEQTWNNSFARAKQRFDQLSFFKKRRLRLEGKDPESLGEVISAEQLDKLYRDDR